MALTLRQYFKQKLSILKNARTYKKQNVKVDLTRHDYHRVVEEKANEKAAKKANKQQVKLEKAEARYNKKLEKISK